MRRYVYLLKVEASKNNNKYYVQSEQPDGTFLVEYGRVDSLTRQLKEMEIKKDYITSIKEKLFGK